MMIDKNMQKHSMVHLPLKSSDYILKLKPYYLLLQKNREGRPT